MNNSLRDIQDVFNPTITALFVFGIIFLVILQTINIIIAITMFKCNLFIGYISLKIYVIEYKSVLQLGIHVKVT